MHDTFSGILSVINEIDVFLLEVINRLLSFIGKNTIDSLVPDYLKPDEE